MVGAGKEAFELSLNLNLNIKCAAVKSVKLAKMKTVDEQQQTRERKNNKRNTENKLVMPIEKILLILRGKAKGRERVHKKLISFIKLTRTEPTNQVNLECVVF